MIDTLSARGTYTLIIFLSKESCIKIGQQGTKRFPKGYYSYTGSALGTGSSSLKQRLARHLRKTGKKKHWHIDFLLAHEEATVTAVVAAQTERKMECELNERIKRQGFAETPILGFGSSDCKGNCESHLLYFGEEDVKTKIVEFYAEKLDFSPVAIEFCDQHYVQSPKV